MVFALIISVCDSVDVSSQIVTHVDDVACSASSGVRVLAAWDVSPQVVDKDALAGLTEEWFQRSHSNN